ncbi:MAG: acetoin utilization protein AcuC [Phycisphaerales bacterium]|jgi:acetoin utilization protein AcuC|nr:acetoin utilization protein AcuC [Phycisphaerales bacterium]
MARAAFIHSDELEKYHYPTECPFKTERAGMLFRKLKSMGMLGGIDQKIVEPTMAQRTDLELFHTPEYLDVLQRASQGHWDVDVLHAGLATPDTPVFLGMYEYAALAAGASLKGAEMILSGDVDIAFNPSGGYHHAHSTHAAGFCYINDVVLACLALAAAGKRVLLLDIDAHHCDGVQEAFYERSDILTMSFHEHGPDFYPGTGAVDEVGLSAGRGFSVNVPLPEDTDDESFARAFKAITTPVIEKFAPDVIVMELGMDCLAGDPLTHLQLTNNAYADALEHIMGFDLPILAVGGGGYNPENSVRGWALTWGVMIGDAGDSDDLSLGMGGVMLESLDWKGGLRDRTIVGDEARLKEVASALDATVENIKTSVFPLIGLPS